MSMPQSNDINLTHTDVMDALSMILNIPVGDIYNQIEKGKFEDLAVQALMTYAAQARSHRPSSDLTQPPLDDIMILQNCLLELETEIQQRQQNQQPFGDLLQDMADIKQLINNKQIK